MGVRPNSRCFAGAPHCCSLEIWNICRPPSTNKCEGKNEGDVRSLWLDLGDPPKLKRI